MRKWLNASDLKPYFKANIARHNIVTSSRGGSVTCLCPFHEEKTASFHIYDDYGHCFGCGWHGDIIRFEADVSGRDQRRNFSEIVKELAELYGVHCEDKGGVKMLRNHKVSPHPHHKGNALSNEEKSKAEKLLKKVITTHDRSDWRLYFYEETIVFTDDPSQQWRILIQGLFSLDSIIWLGSRYTSEASNFHKVADVVRLDLADELLQRPCDCFALGCFVANAQKRRTEYLVGCDYILIESDELIGKKAEDDGEREQNKRMSFAVIQWLNSYDDMSLRAVYDTGGKSLHSIWDKPPDETLKLLKPFCESLGIDSQPLTNATAPLRLPQSNHEKTGKPAKLLYLNPKF